MMAPRSRRSDVGVVDLARELQVSTATVSRALNGSSAVRPDLAQRIREHAEVRGYVANRLARALAANTSRAFVGFVIPYVDTPAYSAVAAECSRRLSEYDTQVILAITENDPDKEEEQLRELLASRVAGIVISPSSGITAQSMDLLSRTPVVEFHRRCGIDAPGVFADDEPAIAESVLHLAAHGHTDIAYLGPSEALSNGRERLRGFRRGLELAGIEHAESRTQVVNPTQDNGRRAALDLLAGPNPPGALIVGGGSLSVGAARAVRESGRRVPAELSLIVYGDPDWFALHEPPLTTVSVSYERIARRTAQLINSELDRQRRSAVAGKDRPDRQQQAGNAVPAELVLGGSTGPVPEPRRGA